jgi:single-strand selective monofunctional uracil DNA glycosylase
MADPSEPILAAARQLADACDAQRFPPPVHTVYNAYRYAWAGHAAYVRRYGGSRKRVVYLGMNPGPWGMAQTGVPFGEVAAVRGWLGIEAVIERPPVEHPKRPVQGFACARSEVSGRRLWGLFAEAYGTADAFFAESFVLNYCPLSFMAQSGANITPDKLPAACRAPLEAACDAHLRAVLKQLRPEIAVGVGGWATRCLQRLQPDGARIGTLLHPSPASPTANREWPRRPLRQLRELGIIR